MLFAYSSVFFIDDAVFLSETVYPSMRFDLKKKKKLTTVNCLCRGLTKCKSIKKDLNDVKQLRLKLQKSLFKSKYLQHPKRGFRLQKLS